MPQYRKKPIIIDAVQLLWKNWPAVCEFLATSVKGISAKNIAREEASDMCGEEGQAMSLEVQTTHGEIAVVRHGDWIIPDSKPGTFYPCKPDIFEKTYEPI